MSEQRGSGGSAGDGYLWAVLEIPHGEGRILSGMGRYGIRRFGCFVVLLIHSSAKIRTAYQMTLTYKFEDGGDYSESNNAKLDVGNLTHHP